MRPPHLTIAVALAVLVGSWLIPAMAEEDGHPAKPKNELSEAWQEFLATNKVSKEDTELLVRLSGHLSADIFQLLSKSEQKLLLSYAANRLGSDNPLSRCWSPDTDPALLTAYHAVEETAHEENKLAPRKATQFFRRWSRTALNGPGQSVQGRPVTLTWSIVPDGTPIPSEPTIGDSDDESSLRERLTDIYGGDAEGDPKDQPWFSVLESIFEDVRSKTGIRYQYEPNDDGARLGSGSPGYRRIRGDIRLGGHPIDGNGATLAYNFFPDNGDMVIDTDDAWFENTGNRSLRLHNTLLHEHGHGLGLEHVCPIDRTKLMEPFINTGFRGLQFDDIFTLQRWYGDPLEHHGNRRSNDNPSNATNLPLARGQSYQSNWLSIDDNNDVDFYALSIPAAGTQLSVRVTPSSHDYLEGEQQNSGQCSAGTPFDSSDIHDLKVALIGPDQSNVLVSINETPAGEAEEIEEFTIPAGGRYFVRVTGDNSNNTQLYKLEVELSSPAISVQINSHEITAESFGPANDTIEPGETVRLEVTLQNQGGLTAQDVQVDLTGPEGFVGFDTDADFGNMPPGVPVTRSFVFALDAPCGSTLPLKIGIEASGSYEQELTFPLSVGTIETILDESFDSSDLPSGWQSSETGRGSGWDPTTNKFDSSPRSAFARDVNRLGTSSLISPAVTLGPSGGTLSFRHYFETESTANTGFDGGVLEVSVDGGAYEDIVDAGATFLEGPYNRRLSNGFQNPLPGRMAWTGDSDGWITTRVALPQDLGSEPVRFRWRLGHDTSEGEDGWHLDSIRVETAFCADTKPRVSLALEDGSTSEWSPQSQAKFSFSTPLPVGVNLTIPLLTEGTAAPTDLSDLDHLILTVGESVLDISASAVPDQLVEGMETLVLSLDPEEVAPEGLSNATITIQDSPYGNWAYAEFGTDSANGPLDDFDGDSHPNLAEYAWQSDPTAASSGPDLNPRRENGALRITAPSDLPTDVLLHAEHSDDLQSWSSLEVQTGSGFFQFPSQDLRHYFRLRYQLLPAAP